LELAVSSEQKRPIGSNLANHAFMPFVAGPRMQGRTKILGTIKAVALWNVKNKYLDVGNEGESAVRPHLVGKAGGSLASLPKTGGLVPHKVFGERVWA
jgi:hypothetical protein